MSLIAVQQMYLENKTELRTNSNVTGTQMNA